MSVAWVAPAEPVSVSSRLASLDILRGATIAGMILVNAQYSSSAAYPAFVHAAWHGWTYADTIFPAFLFLVGFSFVLSTEARRRRGQGASDLLVHAVGRALLIFAAGVFVDALRVPVRDPPFFHFVHHLQLTGALQKIAVCYLAAFLVYLFAGLRGVVLAILGLTTLYLGFLWYFPIPGCSPAELTQTCNFPGYVDRVLLDGFRWPWPGFDPDGLGSAISATTSVLSGTLAGILVQRVHAQSLRIVTLLAAGAVVAAAGLAADPLVPINKQLWTTSYVLLTSGLTSVALGLSLWLIDDRPWRSWLAPLEILGRNALAAYLISRIVQGLPRVHVHGHALFDDLLSPLVGPAVGSLAFAFVVLVIAFLPIWLMNRLQWNLKL